MSWVVSIDPIIDKIQRAQELIALEHYLIF